jgi:hypothetical protein
VTWRFRQAGAGVYERLGLIASSASNPDVTFFDANGIVLAYMAIMRLRKMQVSLQVPAFAVSACRGMRAARRG